MVGAWLGHGMASVNQTRTHCVNQMGKTHSKPLAARYGRGMACARYGSGMLCVNRLSSSCNPLGLSRPVMGLLYVYEFCNSYNCSVNFNEGSINNAVILL